jgi:hypothetical protein
MPKSSPQRKAYNRGYYKHRKQMFIEAQMKCTYGPYAVDIWHMAIREQVGLCKNCGGQGLESKKRQGLEYDHDHITGKFRGLLCGKCNKAIGMLGDNEAGILRALSYIRGDSNV